MKMDNKKIKQISAKIIPILKRGKVTKAGLFGSYSRGEEKKNSDIDILIKIKDSEGFFKLVRLKRELEKVLKKQVDLIEYEYLHPLIKEQALKEEIKLI